MCVLTKKTGKGRDPIYMKKKGKANIPLAFGEFTNIPFVKFGYGELDVRRRID